MKVILRKARFSSWDLVFPYEIS